MNERFLLSWFSLKCFKDVFKLDRLSNRNLLQALIFKIYSFFWFERRSLIFNAIIIIIDTIMIMVFNICVVHVSFENVDMRTTYLTTLKPKKGRKI